jgi:hypothetical protein
MSGDFRIWKKNKSYEAKYIRSGIFTGLSGKKNIQMILAKKPQEDKEGVTVICRTAFVVGGTAMQVLMEDTSFRNSRCIGSKYN